MAINPLKALIFLAGGLVAALAVAWYAGAFAPLAPQTPAAVSAPEGAAPKGDKPAAQAAGKTAKAEAPAASPEVIPPSFDILRVEPDGSIVIAGQAAPNAKVEILNGSQLVGEAQAGAEGDFVAVLDDPLKPGDYQLVLRSTAPDNVVAASPETAVVSIPEQKDGQVLALVEQPGEPSRLITVPEPDPAAPTAEAPQAPAAQPAPQTPAVGEQPAQQQALGNNQPQASSKDAGASSSGGAQPAPEDPQVAAAPEGPAQPSQQPAPPGQSGIAVEAVEIEGRNVFVAGVADPGSTVRVYANDILLGETQTSGAGRFLVETERDLPVGDYIIRADVVAADGAVTARAAVPFEREAGQSMAAVAPPAAAGVGQPAGAQATASPGNEAAPAETSTDGQQKPAGGSAAPAPSTPGQAARTAIDSAAAPASSQQDKAAVEENETQAAASPPTVTAPKLQSVDGAVIIRRGDNLWRISRRVYGRGVRYTTIYLANQDQISDPDRIWPGQVFAVPEETPEGEKADMKAVGDRATTMPKQQ